MHYDSIYLSPHLDDVALSCGGRIAQQTQAGKSVLIVSITAGDPPSGQLPPFAQSHHDSWQLTHDVVQVRREEDVMSCKRLGADWLHWTVRDAIYRRDPNSGVALYNNDVELFGSVNSAENHLVETLVTQLRDLPSADEIVCPLVVGDHVDHQLVRVSAEIAFGSEMLYYEDYPYAQRHGLGGKTDADGWQSMLTKLSPSEIAQKLDAIAAYESQIEHLFDSLADMQNKVTTFATETGGERYWKIQVQPASS